MAGSRVTMPVDKVRAVFGALNDLVNRDVLVGVPEPVSRRENEPIGNAALAYIHEFGSPAANIPARPFLIPGIRDQRVTINAQLKKATEAALDGNQGGVNQALDRAGIAGMNGAQARIRSNIPPPLQPSTIRGRKHSRGTKGRRKGEAEYLEMIAQGATPGVAQTAAGIVALYNTGQLLRSITWVVRKKSG